MAEAFLEMALACVELREHPGLVRDESVGRLFLAACEEGTSSDENRRGHRKLAEALMERLRHDGKLANRHGPTTAGGGFAASVGGPVIFTLNCTMREFNDWRLTNQESYLKGVALEKRHYEPASKENDHDHCEFCSAKFMAAAMPDTLQEGYSTSDGYRWICGACFEDFVDLFNWEVAHGA